MIDLIKLIFDLCLLRKNPQDLPYSPTLLRNLTLTNLAMSFLILNSYNAGALALLRAVFEVALIYGYSGLLLYASNKAARLNQTVGSLLGVDTLISFFALPAVAAMAIGQGGLLASVVMLGLILWHWAIIGHIMRHALEQNRVFGLGVSLLYLLTAYALNALLFPAAP